MNELLEPSPERMVEPPIVDFRFLTDCYACGHVSFTNNILKVGSVRPCPNLLCKSYQTVTYDRITNAPIHDNRHLKPIGPPEKDNERVG